MAKKKNEKDKTVALEPAKVIENTPNMYSGSKYEDDLNDKLSDLLAKEKVQITKKEDAYRYLSADHLIYQSIKEKALSVQKEILNGQAAVSSAEYELGLNALFFDFENNCFSNGVEVKEMPACYSRGEDDLHLCKPNGIYMDSQLFTPAKLFLSDKRALVRDHSYIESFEKSVDQVVNEYNSDLEFSYFCMLPEYVDLFNTQIRRCLNTNKGRIISIPKSIAITYYYLDELQYGDRYCVIDMDGLHPVITQLSIGKDASGKKVILREGFISDKCKIGFSYQDFASKYLLAFEQKYGVLFSENEKDNLISNKQIIPVLSQRNNVTLFRKDGKITLLYDEDIFGLCLEAFTSIDDIFKNYRFVYIASAVNYLITGSSVRQVSNDSAFTGLSIIRNILLADENAVIWKERLPKISLEVIDEKIGRFKTINLIEEENDGQNIRLSIDEEIELPFKGTITLQKGKKEYYLPLKREIYSEDVNSAKEAYFYDKSFPLNDDVLVELVVKYNYMSDSPIKIYARPLKPIKEFSELSNTWVDRHEIEVYTGPVYEGHPKEIKLPHSGTFSLTKKALNRFVNGQTDFSPDKFILDKTGMKIHANLSSISKAHYFIRNTFDSFNVSDEKFERFWNDEQIEEFWDAASEAISLPDSFYGDEHIQDVRQYKRGLARILAEIIVASRYYDPKNGSIDAVLKYLAGLNKTKILIRLSRCIDSEEDDVYNIFEHLAEKLYNSFSAVEQGSKNHEPVIYLRTLSQNCWFSKDWIFMLYNTRFGPQAVQLMGSYICDYLKNEDFRQDKTYRDIMEFLVCLTMAKNISRDMFNPNDENTRDLLENVKKSYEKVRVSSEPDKLASRLEMKQNQGALHGYPNYIYMLIMILSGEGQVDLVGYRDE